MIPISLDLPLVFLLRFAPSQTRSPAFHILCAYTITSSTTQTRLLIRPFLSYRFLSLAHPHTDHAVMILNTHHTFLCCLPSLEESQIVSIGWNVAGTVACEEETCAGERSRPSSATVSRADDKTASVDNEGAGRRLNVAICSVGAHMRSSPDGLTNHSSPRYVS